MSQPLGSAGTRVQKRLEVGGSRRGGDCSDCSGNGISESKKYTIPSIMSGQKDVMMNNVSASDYHQLQDKKLNSDTIAAISGGRLYVLSSAFLLS
jgi:hypothetical protein